MIKRISAFILCLVLLGGSLAGCSSTFSAKEKGSYISAYLTDEIYDFDPANAYYNTEAVNVLGLMYETLFSLTSSGKIKKSLAKSYKTFTDDDGEFVMEITLRPTSWSNGTYALTANDCLFAWKRLLNPENGYAAASLLFDIKNARAYNQGWISVEALGIEVVEQQVIKITFEDNIDVNSFLLNLTNVATAPLLEAAVKKNADWAKKASTLITSGPFKMSKISYEVDQDEDERDIKVKDDYALDIEGNQKTNSTTGEILNSSYKVQKVIAFILERNQYYYRDVEEDALDKYVTPYRIVVDCRMTDEELLTAYQDEKLFYFGSIPLSLRNNEVVSSKVKITDTLSTAVCALNENAEINGNKIFADVHVRRALSLAIDREAIANAIVYAEAATALLGPKVFEKALSGSFRTVGGDLISTTADLTAAQSELSQVEISGFDPSDYSFTIRVASYDEVHIAMASLIASAWNELGFKVTVEEMETIQNNDDRVESDQTTVETNVCDDLFVESIQRKTYQAIIYDLNAFSPSAYSVLSNFAYAFSGAVMDEETTEYTLNVHNTGYNNTEYNNLMEAVYFIPYYTTMEANPEAWLFDTDDPDPDQNPNPYLGFGLDNYDDYVALYNTITEIYAKYGITPTSKSKEWAAQKALLLHEAEKVLMQDLPVIPIVFNQNATLTNTSFLSKLNGNYYIPNTFTKAVLKSGWKYTYVFYKFPANTFWDYYGLKEEPET